MNDFNEKVLKIMANLNIDNTYFYFAHIDNTLEIISNDVIIIFLNKLKLGKLL